MTDVTLSAAPAAAPYSPAVVGAAQKASVSPGVLAFAGMIARGPDDKPAYIFSSSGQWEAAANSVPATPLTELPEYRYVATSHGREWQLFASQGYFERTGQNSASRSGAAVDAATLSGRSCAASVVRQADGSESLQPQVTCFKEAQNLGLVKKEVTDYFHSPAYLSDVRKVANEAKAYMISRVGQIVAQGGKPSDYGIVLDIDETSLFNIGHIEKVDYGYIKSDSQAWERSARAPAIEPTLELYRAARALGVKVFFVTGRKEAPGERNATIANLRHAGYTAGWDKLVMVQPGKTYDSVADYKGLERQKIEEKGCHILLTMGDQWSDLAPSKLGDGKAHAEQAYKLPNPAYLIP